MTNHLGKIREIDLREIFKNEARDLTPWLAEKENLQALGEEIGIPLRLIQVEAEVGRFNVDILAQEEDSERKIIIENQLESTDHDHLGKIITYASGHNANVIVWIFREIRDEHRQAIEWLNEHTDENVDFFAIKLRLWKIDDSKPAPRFDIVASPNEWAKTIRNKAPGEFTDTKLQQLEFWTKFRSWTQDRDKKIRLQTPRPQHWYDVSIGSSDAHIALTVNTREETLGCEIYINRSKELFTFLQSQKNDIENELGHALEWIDANKASRIKVSISEFNILDQNKTEEYYSWILSMMAKFRKVFTPRISSFKENSRDT